MVNSEVRPPLPAARAWPWVTICLIILTFGCYLLQHLHPGGVAGAVNQWGCNPSLIAAGGSFPHTGIPAWWGMLNATFLHTGWVHLGYNLSVFVVLGIGLEQVLGHRRMLLLYLLTGLLGVGSMVLTLPAWNIAASGGSVVAAGLWAAWIIQPRSCMRCSMPYPVLARGWKKSLQMLVLIVISCTILAAAWRWFGYATLNLAGGAGFGVFASISFCGHLYGALLGGTFATLSLALRHRLPLVPQLVRPA